MILKVLVLGGGGRESALVWKLAQSPHCGRLYAMPGNPGMAQIAELVQGLDLNHLDELADWCERREIDLVVVGPEQPLVDGIVDLFRSRGIAVFGPDSKGAMLEGSKSFAKEFMERHDIPTAAHASFTDLNEAQKFVEHAPWPLVIKADGLAAGKGVALPDSTEEAFAFLRDVLSGQAFGEAGSKVVIEERMHGPEMSVFALCDGHKAWTLATAQDYKRIFDNDKGPNTGGMGAISPSPHAQPERMKEIVEDILQPVIQGMADEGTPYVGILYLGLMLTATGPRVIEFNCRFGDPETQAILPLLSIDLLETFWHIAKGDALPDWRVLEADPEKGFASCLVLASGGYPGDYKKGLPIHGFDEVKDVQAFVAGMTRDKEGLWYTSGGRVMNLVATAATPEDARSSVYKALAGLHFEGMQHRKDIGQ
jgi:phosphoribosylamine---glycine ligase